MSYLAPSEIAIQFCKSAQQKNAFTNIKLLIYSLLGGSYIALGGLLSLVVVGGMTGIAASNPGITKFFFGSLFPVGLILVVIGGAELFTSDCAVIPFGVLHRQLPIKSIFRVWSIVYLGNFIGALFVAYFIAFQTGILSVDSWRNSTIKLAEHKIESCFWITFVKGIVANWLVCMAVWISYSAKEIGGKILALWFPVMCFVVFGMEHSVANMFFFPTAMFLGAHISLYQFLIVNLLPATLGNIIGGVVLVALPYWFMFNEQVYEARKYQDD